jgi:AcrR family transcriptional regulator
MPTEVDGRRVRGDKTRRAILQTAVNVASVDGLDGLTIGRLATELKMSKSGLFAHFGSKEELQISTVRAAAAIFVHRVMRPAEEAHEPGLARLHETLRLWIDYIERGVFAGGCFFSNATVEMGGRGGPVRDAVWEQMGLWYGALADAARDAITRGELRADTDPEQLAFEVDAIGSAVSSGWLLANDPVVFQRGHRAILRRLEADATEAGRAVLAAAAH